MTALKVVGVELTSMGRYEAQSDSEIEIALEDLDGRRYRKLVIAEGRIVGAILLGYPLNTPAVIAAVKQGLDVSDSLDALCVGQWDRLREKVT